MQDDTIDERTLHRLRFLAEATVTLLSGDRSSEGHGDDRPTIPPDAAETMLRALLRHAIPVLRGAQHHHLAAQIEAVLAAVDEASPDVSGGIEPG